MSTTRPSAVGSREWVLPVEAPSRPAGPRRERGRYAIFSTNGTDVVEISHAAMRRYVEANGSIPLPVSTDFETGDRRVYDAKRRLRAVHDGDGHLREVSSQGPDGSLVRVTFPRGTVS